MSKIALTVNFESISLKIPIDKNCTISQLMTEAADRYRYITHTDQVVTVDKLQAKDGAIFWANDTIKDACCDDKTLYAQYSINGTKYYAPLPQRSQAIQQDTQCTSLDVFLTETTLLSAKWGGKLENNSPNVTMSVKALQPYQLAYWNDFDRNVSSYRPETDLMVKKLVQPELFKLDSEQDTQVNIYSHILEPVKNILKQLYRDESITIKATNNSNNSDADFHITKEGSSKCPLEIKPISKFGHKISTRNAASSRREILTAEEYIRVYEEQKRDIKSTSDIYWGTFQVFGYMVDVSNTKYGILSTYNTWWYYHFDPMTLTLHVSDAYQISNKNNMRALFYVIDLCFKEDSAKLSEIYQNLPPRTPQVIQERDANDQIGGAGNRTQNVSRIAGATTFDLSRCRETLGHGAVGHVFRYVNFVQHGVKYDEIAVKAVNIADDPKSRMDKVLHERDVFMRLLPLQGHCIPTLLGVYLMGSQMLLCMSLVRGRWLEDEDLEDEELLSKLRRRIRLLHVNHVLHNDLRHPNILIDGDREPWIVDFERASIHLDKNEDELGRLENLILLPELRTNKSENLPWIAAVRARTNPIEL